MLRIDDVWDEAKGIFGACDDVKLLKWLSDAVALVANKSDLEGYKGTLDICSVGCSCSEEKPCSSNTCGKRCVTLPREVETVLAVNIGGQPTLGFGTLFNFHLNGPGDCRGTCMWSWQDQGQWHSTYRDLITPAKLVAYLNTPEDNGKQLIVYGYDDKGNVLRRMVGGKWENGYQVPTIFGVALPDVGAPNIARITGVFKDRTISTVRLSTIDDSGGTGVTLSILEPDEQVPQYRRIILNRACTWVRIAYRKGNPIFHSRYDHVPLKSRRAFLLAVQAVKSYDDLQIAEAHAYEADAARLEIEAQNVTEPTTTLSPPQIVDWNNLRDKSDYGIY